jgi:hypothetical protein
MVQREDAPFRVSRQFLKLIGNWPSRNRNNLSQLATIYFELKTFVTLLPRSHSDRPSDMRTGEPSVAQDHVRRTRKRGAPLYSLDV